MDIANPVGELMLGKFLNQLSAVPGLGISGATGQAEVFEGYIKDATVIVAAGRTTQDITFQLIDPGVAADVVGSGKPVKPTYMPMIFKGNISLADLTQQLNVTLPAQLIAKFIPDRKIKKQFIDIFPSGIPIVMGGTTPAPKVEVPNIARQVTEGLIKSQLLGGGGDGKNQSESED